MRTVQWLFVVSAALFIAGVGFIIAGARTSVRAETAPVAVPVDIGSVATVKQIMQGVVSPAASVVFESVSTVVSAAGIEEFQPETDEEWDFVGSNAAMLVESAALLMSGDRAVDRQEWATQSQALADAAGVLLEATRSHDRDKVLEYGEVLNQSCDGCHRTYMRN